MSNFCAPFAGTDLGNRSKVEKVVKSAESKRTWKNPGLSLELKAFINALLRFEPANRLGFGGWSQVKNHTFFTCVKFDWQELE